MEDCNLIRLQATRRSVQHDGADKMPCRAVSEGGWRCVQATWLRASAPNGERRLTDAWKRWRGCKKLVATRLTGGGGPIWFRKSPQMWAKVACQPSHAFRLSRSSIAKSGAVAAHGDWVCPTESFSMSLWPRLWNDEGEAQGQLTRREAGGTRQKRRGDRGTVYNYRWAKE
ncbi:uncharacterized protein EI97DRAFT_429204 [Westerdykella ornata]|uniref:Uncharacterized protein n=1 Tax=Westerdykella ornata TaxID=318751 RepID=A0A6A6JX01_WESOR|nr:uncharacterized protein EI97DRAFT_429204 [Westerdykella ornata]KAF2281141.1 hypothetical protein EI97DRAFT_429204 [Westerdykella ornata]